MLHGRFRVPLLGRHVQGNGRVGQQDHVPRATSSKPTASELRRQPKGLYLVLNSLPIKHIIFEHIFNVYYEKFKLNCHIILVLLY